jgi:hypothetical protein
VLLPICTKTDTMIRMNLRFQTKFDRFVRCIMRHAEENTEAVERGVEAPKWLRKCSEKKRRSGNWQSNKACRVICSTEGSIRHEQAFLGSGVDQAAQELARDAKPPSSKSEKRCMPKWGA